MYVKGYEVLSFGRNLSNKYEKELLDTVKQKGLDTLETVTKNLRHKAAEATGEF